MQVTAAAAAVGQSGQCLSTVNTQRSAVPLSVYSPHTSASHDQGVKPMSSLFKFTGVRPTASETYCAAVGLPCITHCQWPVHRVPCRVCLCQSVSLCSQT